MPNVAVEPPSVNLASSTTTVGAASATPLPAVNLALRRTIVLQNVGTATVYVGAAGVTTATGIPLEPGEKQAYALGHQVQLYAISSSGDQDVRALEQS